MIERPCFSKVLAVAISDGKLDPEINTVLELDVLLSKGTDQWWRISLL